jgi:hypothetical protein
MGWEDNMNDEQLRICKEKLVGYYTALSQHLPVTKSKSELWNTNIELYRYTILLDSFL